MKAGDRIRFRDGSTAWKGRGLARNAQGVAFDLYRVPMRGEIRVDARFGDSPDIERGIAVEELEVIRPGWTPPKTSSDR